LATLYSAVKNVEHLTELYPKFLCAIFFKTAVVDFLLSFCVPLEVNIILGLFDLVRSPTG